jgi:hypothetical protein
MSLSALELRYTSGGRAMFMNEINIEIGELKSFSLFSSSPGVGV